MTTFIDRLQTISGFVITDTCRQGVHCTLYCSCRYLSMWNLQCHTGRDQKLLSSALVNIELYPLYIHIVNLFFLVKSFDLIFHFYFRLSSANLLFQINERKWFKRIYLFLIFDLDFPLFFVSFKSKSFNCLFLNIVRKIYPC